MKSDYEVERCFDATLSDPHGINVSSDGDGYGYGDCCHYSGGDGNGGGWTYAMNQGRSSVGYGDGEMGCGYSGDGTSPKEDVNIAFSLLLDYAVWHMEQELSK